jgi:hypothetical protein
MTAPTYTPRAGSLASQVISFFRNNPDEELLLDDITDKFDATRGNFLPITTAAPVMAAANSQPARQASLF